MSTPMNEPNPPSDSSDTPDVPDTTRPLETPAETSVLTNDESPVTQLPTETPAATDIVADDETSSTHPYETPVGTRILTDGEPIPTRTAETPPVTRILTGDDPGRAPVVTAPAEPAGAGAALASSSIITEKPDHPMRMRTVVLGMVLLVIAGAVLVAELTDVSVDPGAVVLALMIGAGVLLVAGARRP